MDTNEVTEEGGADRAAIGMVLAEVEQRAAGGTLPPELRDLSARHLQHLMALVETMHAAGVDETLVRRSVRGIVESYEQELVEALVRLGRANA